MRIRRGFLGVVVSMIFWGGMALAQVTTGTILGTVSDATGAVIPGATVTIRNTETGISRTTTTDAAGRYRAPQLGLGDYEISAGAAGFQTAVRTGITLTVGREAAVDFSLQVGAVAEKITVTGEAPLVETTSGTVASLVDEKTMRELPLNGRSFADLAALQPGVVSNLPTLAAGFNGVYAGSASRRSFSGAKPQQSQYLLDGLEVATPSEGMPVASVLGQQLGVDAIREFTVLQNNFGAQYGRSVGGIVNAVTQSGTNELHGSAFEFLRNDALDARNFFNVTSQEKPPLRQNQFGASLGGPVQKDKTFFFINYEAIRKREGTFTISTVPTAASRVSAVPNAFALLDTLPTPNGPERGGGVGDYYFVSRAPQQEDYGTVRMDRQLGQSDSLFGRLTIDRSNRSDPTPLRLPSKETYKATSTGAYWIAALSETHIFSPTLINTARLGYVRRNDDLHWTLSMRGESFSPTCGGLGRNSVYISGTCMAWHSIGGITLFGDVGPNLSGPAFFVDNTFDYSDTVNINTRGHSFAIGGEIKRYRMEESNEPWVYGQVVYNNLTDVLNAKPLFLTALFNSEGRIADVRRGWRQTYGSLFVQDDWQIRPKLTLNLGLRWEDISGPHEVKGKLGTMINPLKDAAVTPLGKEDALFEIRDGMKGFSPRFGFAWSPFGNQSTVVRGGFGAFKEMPLEYVYQLALNVAPYSTRFQIFNPSIPFTFTTGNTTEPLLVPRDFKIPYTLQWNLSVERQITNTLVAKAAYIGTRNINQLAVYNPNQAPAIESGGRWVVPDPNNVPNRNLTSLRMISPLTGGWYNAAQVVLEKRFSSGYQVNGSYTWAKNIDMNSTGTKCAELTTGSAFTVYNSQNIASDKSLSSLHISQNVIFSYAYELPFGSGRRYGSQSSGVVNHIIGGWSVRGTNTFRSGLPITVVMTPRISGNKQQSNPERPDLIPNGNNNPVLDNWTPEKYYDTSQFKVPAIPAGFAGVFGNLGRNTVMGPGLKNWDLSFSKANSIGEGKNLEFRAEFFNVLNHPNFSQPNETVFVTAAGGLNPSAGRITRTSTTNRQVQFGLKLTF